MDAQYLYLDLETDLDENIADRWSLPPIIPVEKMPKPQGVISGTVADVTATLGGYDAMALHPDWVTSVWEAEKAGKDRAGVLKVISTVFHKRDDYIKRLPLDPQLCSIVSAGVALDDKPALALLKGDEISEAHLLRMVWDYVAAANIIVGWKVINFDLRVLVMRSIQLSVKPTRALDLRKWGNPHAIDLKIELWGNDTGVKGLKETAMHFGIKIPAGDMDGSMVWSYTPEQLREYQLSDVIITRKIHLAVAGFLSSVPPIFHPDNEAPF